MRATLHPLAVALLTPPSLLYALMMRLRNRHFDRAGASARVGIPVLSVGNLTVGGTGKTPVVAWLVARLLEEGRRPAVVSRGYRGNVGRGPLIVSRGGGPLCSPVECGDEPFQLAHRLRETLVVVGADRLTAARTAAEAGADVAVLDDGFQHRRLARDLDLVLLEAERPFDNGRLLPAGLLREPIDGLRRADAVLVTRSAVGADHAEIERTVRHHKPGVPILRSRHRILGLFDSRGRRVDLPERAVVFCGIGNPEQFRRDVEQLGLEIVKFRPFSDHHPYSSDQIRRLRDLAAAREACLVTTEKDLARLGATANLSSRPRVLALRIEAEILEPGPLLDLLRQALARGAGRG